MDWLGHDVRDVPQAVISLPPRRIIDVACSSSCPTGRAEVPILSGSASAVGGLALRIDLFLRLPRAAAAKQVCMRQCLQHNSDG
jgi:hypothetical protein